MNEARGSAVARPKGPLPLFLDDVVVLRKPHPCGGDTPGVPAAGMRLGADIGIRCTTCDHRVLVARAALERDIKRFASRGPLAPAD
jgi:hypothetical protein